MYTSGKNRFARYVQNKHWNEPKFDRIRNFAKSVSDRHCII